MAQVDEEGYQQLLMKEIVDHRKASEAIEVGNDFYITHLGTKRQNITTSGWKLCIEWMDSSHM